MQRRLMLPGLFIGLAALCVLLGGAFAKDSLAAPANGCVAGPIKIGPSPSFSVTLTRHQCYKAGRAIPTGVTYSYKQLDYAGSACGSPVNNKRGPGFTPRLNTTYFILVNFSVHPLKVGTGIQPVSTGWRKLSMGRWQLQCGRQNSDNLPSIREICEIDYPAGSCAFRITDPRYSSIPLPQFGSQPLLIGNAVYGPKLLIPRGTCIEEVLHRWTLMGAPNNMALWHCPGHVVVEEQLLVYYYPPGSDTVCPGPARFSSLPPYTVGPLTTIPNEIFTRVQLPAAAKNWGGQALFVFHERVIPNDAFIDTAIAEQNANVYIKFPGTQDGCDQMTQFALK